MRSFSSLAWLLIFTLLSALGCKSKNTSELKVTDAQRASFKGCIVATIMGSFRSPVPDSKAVASFADSVVRRAPSDNETAIDTAFAEYAGALGCDPKKVESKNSVGTSLVAEWVISPFNPANTK